MPTQRLILWIIFSMSLLFLWDAWQRHQGQPTLFGPQPQKAEPVAGATGGTASPANTAAPARSSATGTDPSIPTGPAPAAAAAAQIPGASDAASTRTEVSDVSHMRARHYDAELGRFLEADDRVPDVHNPHQLNRYAYAGGNPVTIADPSGHGWLDALFFIFIAAVAIIATVLSVGAAVSAWVVFAQVLAMTLSAAMAFHIVSGVAADGRYGEYITIQRAMVVGALVALAVATAGVMSTIPVLKAIFHVQTLAFSEGSAWLYLV
jgi:RHS repeat-associated protein